MAGNETDATENESEGRRRMATTTFFEGSVTRTWRGKVASQCSKLLLDQYNDLIQKKKVERSETLTFERLLGSGGQGVVYRSHRHGADGFTLPIAVKIFAPECYDDDRAYNDSMSHIANISSLVSRIQHDHLLDVHNWIDAGNVRMMIMECVDGFDLSRLLCHDMLAHIKNKVSEKRWNSINDVVVTAGPAHPRLKPGIAIAIIRDCLSALAALHREGIVHCDIKPANVMLKRTGSVKIVDIGSALEIEKDHHSRACTPIYAAPEVLEGGEITPRSDLASLGYMLIEMLSGVPPFDGRASRKDLLEAKRLMAQKLPQFLPPEVVSSELLMNFCRGLIAPDPNRRFPSAEAAELLKEGAAGFHRQLVKGDLASEYENDIRIWLGELEDYDPKQC